MRVLHLISTTGPGGAETIFVELATGLPPERWRGIPLVYGPGWVKDALMRCGREPLVLAPGRKLDLSFVSALRSLIRREGIGLVHSHLAGAALYGGLAAAAARVPAIATLHGSPDLAVGGSLDRLRHHLIRSAHWRIVLVSHSLRAEAVRRGLLEPVRAEVIHNGIDTQRFRPAGEEPALSGLRGAAGEVLVASVGNVRTLKDYPTLLRAAARVNTKAPGRFRFVIAGATDAPFYPELLAMRNSLGLDERVDFLGFRQDVEHLLRSVDVFLLTSSREGFSLVTVQAMATGLPVVATRSGGPEEIVTDGRDGLLVPPGDADAIAGALLSLGSDVELGQRLGARARETACARFSIESMLERYEGVYSRAARAGSSVGYSAR